LEAARNILTGQRALQRASDPFSSFIDGFSRPVLIFDQDGVLAFLTEAIVTALNARYGLGLLASNLRTYWIEQVLSPEQSLWLSNVFFQSPATYANLAPDLSGIAACNALHQAGFYVILSSDRPKTVRGVTDDWLTKWRVQASEVVIDGRGSKDALCEKHGPTNPCILFDDNPTKWLTVARPGVEVWSPSRPWTPANWKAYKNVWVFDSWDQVLERLGVSSDVPIPAFSRAVPANTAAGGPPSKGE